MCDANYTVIVRYSAALLADHAADAVAAAAAGCDVTLQCVTVMSCCQLQVFLGRIIAAQLGATSKKVRK